MKKTILAAMLTLTAVTLSAAEMTGFWQTIDDKTKLPKSVVAVYENDGKLYGRIIMTYREDGKTIKETVAAPQTKADKVKGDPYFCGLDMIWNMTIDKNGKAKGGKILNPPEGKIYSSEMWLDNGELIVRGKIGPFGRNQTWKRFDSAGFPAGFSVPDITKFTPVIPEVK
ncbi:hypothetical protein AAIR98_000965 [Elusimicrobium simillimum]|uniref:DUF2147 domain-containing protein n=1 Tax=Elusimicrobium simillimum TaxID=3143438 RepID=UPI003C6FC458